MKKTSATNVAVEQKPIAEMSTAEMVAEYNRLTDKSIKKFSSRAAGEKQLEKAREFMVIAKAVVEGAVKEDERTGQDRRHEERRTAERREHKPMLVVQQSLLAPNATQVLADEPTDEEIAESNKAPVYPKAKKEAKPSVSRSQAISESWNKSDVAAKRAQRDNVKVGTSTFRSVREAFKALGLPLSKHIKFRMELKAAGVKEFKNGDKTYKFSIVDQKELPVAAPKAPAKKEAAPKATTGKPNKAPAKGSKKQAAKDQSKVVGE